MRSLEDSLRTSKPGSASCTVYRTAPFYFLRCGSRRHWVNRGCRGRDGNTKRESRHCENLVLVKEESDSNEHLRQIMEGFTASIDIFERPLFLSPFRLAYQRAISSFGLVNTLPAQITRSTFPGVLFCRWSVSLSFIVFS
jgi:hypothetical protein